MICSSGPNGNSSPIRLGSGDRNSWLCNGQSHQQQHLEQSCQYEYSDDNLTGIISSSSGFGSYESFDHLDNLGQHVYHQGGIDTVIEPIEVSVISSSSSSSILANTNISSS